jgi:hypothetical protein
MRPFPEASEPSSLDHTAPTGDWEEFGRSTNETYKWPDGNVDRYTEFVSYRGTGGFTGVTLALGYLNNGDAVGFVLGTSGGTPASSRRTISSGRTRRSR